MIGGIVQIGRRESRLPVVRVDGVDGLGDLVLGVVERGYREQAEAMIKIAVEAEPENAAYLDSMGWVLFKLGRYGEALPYLEKAVKISTGTGDETLYDHLADVYDRLERPNDAIAACSW